MAFERGFTDLEQLKAEPLFRQQLIPDIVENFKAGKSQSGDVFPAVRKNRIDFYCRGGKLFSYTGRNGFTTHHKYASVLKFDNRRPYINDGDLKAVASFIEGYERIKENCSLYSGVEAVGVSQIYGRYSCAKHHKSHRVVVLDIEVSLRRDGVEEEAEPGVSTRANKDRIDLLMFDTNNGLLRFFEAKDFTNNEIRAIPGNAPKIVSQMERYKKQLNTEHVRKEMLVGYTKQVEVINRLFDLEVSLPKPVDIDPIPRLLVFGYDESQRTRKLNSEVERLKDEYGLVVRKLGAIKNVNPNALFDGE